MILYADLQKEQKTELKEKKRNRRNNNNFEKVVKRRHWTLKIFAPFLNQFIL